MDIVQRPATLVTIPRNSPVCILAGPQDHALIGQAIDALGLNHDLLLRDHVYRRPVTQVEAGAVAAVTFVAQATGYPIVLQLHAADKGLLVVAADEGLAVIRPALAKAEPDAFVALSAAVVAIAHAARDVMDDLAQTANDLMTQGRQGPSSAATRSQIIRTRPQLLVLQQLFSEQHRLLAAEEDLSQALPAPASRLLRRAEAVFGDNATLAERMYAAAGDLLTQQSAIVTERLTVVSTTFLPLTVGVGFFGMNFTWMTDRIESAPAFVLLGIGVPLVLMVATGFVIRRHSGPS